MAGRSLSPDRILTSATTLMRRHGVQAVTIRGLAESLDVTPMAIYRHFDNKEALLGALLDKFLSDADLLPAATLHWDEWLLQVGRNMCGALVAEPDWMVLLSSSGMHVRLGTLEVLAACREVMEPAGFSTDDVLHAFFAMAQISIGAACIETRLNKMDLDQDFAIADPALESRVTRAAASPAVLRTHHGVERSLQFLVTALRGCLPQNAPV